MNARRAPLNSGFCVFKIAKGEEKDIVCGVCGGGGARFVIVIVSVKEKKTLNLCDFTERVGPPSLSLFWLPCQ